MSETVKILLTGGCGFIGRNFLLHIRSLGGFDAYDVVNVDKLTYAANTDPWFTPPHYRHVLADICDREAMTRVFYEFRPHVVVNMAAESHVDRSIDDASPFVRSNVLGAQVLLDCAVRFGVGKFVQISTDEVYGALEPGGEPWTEDRPLHPNSPYSASKASAEMLALSYARTHGLQVAVTRSTNNYGPWSHAEKFIPTVIRIILNGGDVPVYGDGQQSREWLSVEDNCAGIMAVCTCGVGHFNLGSGMRRTNLQVVRDIEACLDIKANVRHVIDRKGHDRHYAVDASKAFQVLGWKPKVSWEQGIEKTVRWYAEKFGK